ncbi:MAG TPA: hypothetical protein VNR60_12005 [Croceibacterium sp.]|nr:hypothetical protein [Croceibacterium sp.]
MTGTGWASLIALLAWLILAFSALRSHRIGARKAITMALAWSAIFMLCILVFTAIGH